MAVGSHASKKMSSMVNKVGTAVGIIAFGTQSHLLNASPFTAPPHHSRWANSCMLHSFPSQSNGLVSASDRLTYGFADPPLLIPYPCLHLCVTLHAIAPPPPSASPPSGARLRSSWARRSSAKPGRRRRRRRSCTMLTSSLGRNRRRSRYLQEGGKLGWMGAGRIVGIMHHGSRNDMLLGVHWRMCTYLPA